MNTGGSNDPLAKTRPVNGTLGPVPRVPFVGSDGIDVSATQSRRHGRGFAPLAVGVWPPVAFA